MRNIYFFIAWAVCALFPHMSLAQATGYSTLRIRLSDRSPIAVNIDGRFIERQTSTLTLDGLEPGLHRVEVYSMYGYRRRPVRIYTGTIRLHPGTVNIGWVDVHRRILRMRTRPAYGSDEPPRRERDGRDPESQEEDTEDRAGYGSFPRGRDDVREDEETVALPNAVMESLRRRITDKVTDTEKLRLLKAELGEESPSTAQVRVMLGWLSFESSRLDFAKWAYDRVSDPGRYRQLEDAFSSGQSREEFRRAISDR